MASALDGMCLTEHGWVRVYGSRCVRPPLIVADVARPRPVTVDAWQYAQSLTSKVGPIAPFLRSKLLLHKNGGIW